MKQAVLITGGQRGIGFGIARALAGEGFSVALVAEIPRQDDAVSEALEMLGPSARYFQHDVRNIDRVPDLLDAVERELGPLTTLVNNAGVSSVLRGDMLDVVPENFDTVLDLNLRGTFFLSQSVARRMTDTTSNFYRSIIFVTSVSASLASVDRAEYCISKAASAMMADLFAARLAAQNIGVFELRPGIISTDMTAAMNETYSKRIDAGLVPARRWGYPADIGRAVLPLVTGQMAFSTGAIIPVDGGLSIGQL